MHGRWGLVGRVVWSGLAILLVVALIWACSSQPDTPSPESTPTATTPAPSPTKTAPPTEVPTPTSEPSLTPEASPVSEVTPVPILTSTAVPTATPIPAPRATPTPIPTPIPIPPCNPEQVVVAEPHPYKESGLDSLWHQFPWAYCELVQRPWISEGGDDPNYTEPIVLLYLSQMIIPDEATAIKVVSLPFLDTIELGDSDVMEFLAEVSQTDPAGLLELLSHDSVTTGDNGPIQLIYLDTKNPGAAAEIAALSWVADGLYEFEHGTVTLLQEAAIASNRLFRHLMDSELAWITLGTGVDQSALETLVAWSLWDEDTVIRLASMPFLETIEFADAEAVRRLRELAENDPEGLRSVLSHPTLADGIRDELAVHVSLLYLEQTNQELAAAINELPWVQDGITYVPPRNWGSANPDPREHETVNVLDLIEMGIRAPDLILQLVAKSWVRDGLSGAETSVIGPLFNLSSSDPQVAVQLLSMQFLDRIDPQDSEVLWTLAMLTENSGVPLRDFLSNPLLSGGISNDNISIVQLLEVKTREPERYASIEGLSWIQDGIDVSEAYAVTVLTELAVETDAVFTAVTEKNWVGDGLTREEATAIYHLITMSGLSWSEPDVDTTLRIIVMPFLNTFEPVDAAAVAALARLHHDGDRGHLQQVLNHPSLSEGIVDEDALVIAVLATVAEKEPEKLTSLLDPEQIYREERNITLPLAGEMTVATLRSTPGTFRTLAILEDVVRQYETFMKVAYPSNVAAIVAIEGQGPRGGGGPSGIIYVHPEYVEDTELIAHEAAHTYWNFYPPWIREGAAELMAKIVIGELDQAANSLSETGCSLAKTLGELDQLTYGPGIDEDAVWWSGCSYTMGLGLYADLYNSLGDEEFRRGFGGLYLKMRNEEHNDECFGVERGLCYVQKAFVEDASPGFADDAGGVIDRWYYGESQ